MFVSLSSSMADRLYSSLLILAVYTVSRRTCPVDHLLHVDTSVVHCKCRVIRTYVVLCCVILPRRLDYISHT
jgi:hypothetical protein